MELDLRGKVIIVTGGASGIGEGIALALAEEGAQVCILDRNEQAMGEVKKAVVKNGGHAFARQTELTKRTDCREAIDQILLKFGKIDGLVNNAGLNDGVGLEHGDLAGFEQSLERNVGHYLTMAELTFPELVRSQGAMVNICSKTAETGQGGTSGYAAANGARLAMTRALAAEGLASGVRVNAVVVAECFTPQYKWWISRQADPESTLQAIHAKIPLGNRMTTCAEIAAMVLFLLSPRVCCH